MKRKTEDENPSQPLAKKLRTGNESMNQSTDVQPLSVMDIWRSIEYFCDMKSLPQLNMVAKAFSNFSLDVSYEKLYVWRWKSNFITADELQYFQQNENDEELIDELINESQKSLFSGCSDFLDPVLSTKSPCKSRYYHRVSLLPNAVNIDRIYPSKEDAIGSKVTIYDRSTTQHEQEEARYLEYIKRLEERQLTRGRRAQQPRNEDPLAGLPASLEFIFIGPSAAPIVIRTQIKPLVTNPYYFKVSVWSYSTNQWCDLFTHKHNGDESQEEYYPLCYSVISLLYGRPLDQTVDVADYFCEQFRQLVVMASQLPRGAYTNTTIFVPENDI